MTVVTGVAVVNREDGVIGLFSPALRCFDAGGWLSSLSAAHEKLVAFAASPTPVAWQCQGRAHVGLPKTGMLDK